MPKIAIIAYWYPPLQAAGSVRAYHFAKWAKENGFDAFVITIDPTDRFAPKAHDSVQDLPNVPVYRTKSFNINEYLKGLGRGSRKTSPAPTANHAGTGLLSKIKSGVKSRIYYVYKHCLLFPDECIPWYFRARKQVREIIEREQPDVVLTTAPPNTAFFFGAMIKRVLPNCLWVADYRDLWSQHEIYLRPWGARHLEQLLEKRIVRNADLLVSTTPTFCSKLKRLHPNKMVETIYNGYDDIVKHTPQNTSRFTLTYTGAIYQSGNRDPKIIFQAVRELIDSGDVCPSSITIQFVGSIAGHISQQAREYDLNEVVEIVPAVSRAEALKIQRESNLLLLIEWSEGAVPIKFYEYLATSVPVLVLAQDQSPVVSILAETDGGRHVRNTAEAKAAILQYYGNWQKTGMNELVSVNEELKQYSREEQSRALYRVIHDSLREREKTNA